MSRTNTIFVLGLAAGAGLGFLASGGLSLPGTGAEPAPNTTPAEADAHAHHHAQTYEVPQDAVPSITLTLSLESPCTFNLQIDLANFRFAPENVNGAHVDGEGHAHLYAGDVKLARIYGRHFHATAPSGSTDITVTLNGNDHATLVHDGQPITASAPLTGC